MTLSVTVKISTPPEEVWKTITDFKNCADYIDDIINIEILEEPKNTLVGFKWKETRIMFGKKATETMWITDYSENEFYQCRAESHGSVYVSLLSVKPVEKQTQLTMCFSAKPQSVIAKIVLVCTGFMMKRMLKKTMSKDLNDIKRHLESNLKSQG